MKIMNIFHNIICVLDQLCNIGWSLENALTQLKVIHVAQSNPVLQTPTVVIMDSFLGPDSCVFYKLKSFITDTPAINVDT